MLIQNKTKTKKKKIILIDQEKVFDKIQYAFIRKTLNKLDIEGTILNMIKGIYKSKSRANIIINGERPFPLASGTTLQCLSHHLYLKL